MSRSDLAVYYHRTHATDRVVERRAFGRDFYLASAGARSSITRAFVE